MKYFASRLIVFFVDNVLKVYKQKAQFIHVNSFFCSTLYVHVLFSNFQFNTHNVYLQEAYGDRMEFPDKDDKFDIENYVE